MGRLNNHALSLVELVIASVISAIVISGLFVIMLSMQNVSKDTGNSSYIDTSAIATVTQIIKEANNAVGYGPGPAASDVNPNSPLYDADLAIPSQGILIGAKDELADNTFCILQDTDATPDSTPNQAVCFTQLTNYIFSCTFTDLTIRRRDAKCATSGKLIGTAITGLINNTKPKHVANRNNHAAVRASNVSSVSNPIFPIDDDTPKNVFSITIITRPSPGADKSQSNPEAVATGSTAPAAYRY